MKNRWEVDVARRNPHLEALGVEFREESHTYPARWYPGGNLPSVTGVLRDNGFTDFRWVKAFYRDRGSAAHAAVHYACEGDLDATTVDARIQPYVDAALRFLTDMDAETEDVERVVASRTYGFAGKLDWLGTLRKGTARARRRALVDWKSSNTAHWATRLQLAGYSIAEFEMTQRAILDRWAVLLHGDGTYNVIDYSSEPAAAQADFLAALRCTNIRRANRVPGLLDMDHEREQGDE